MVIIGGGGDDDFDDATPHAMLQFTNLVGIVADDRVVVLRLHLEDPGVRVAHGSNVLRRKER